MEYQAWGFGLVEELRRNMVREGTDTPWNPLAEECCQRDLSY